MFINENKDTKELGIWVIIYWGLQGETEKEYLDLVFLSFPFFGKKK